VTELSFSAVILTGKSPAGRDDDEKNALLRALEIFYDMGVEDIFISAPGGAGAAFQGHPLLQARQGPDSWGGIFAAAQAMNGTHLLVLHSGFPNMDPVFFVRLMQMSCLGMGVLPFIGENCEPLAACYPMAIRKLESSLGQPSGEDPEAPALAALGKGLVARYNVPPGDGPFFDRSVPDVLSTGQDYLSKR
jgi:hypothetical protein